MPIQAKIKFDEAAYNVKGFDENNGRDYVKYGDGNNVLDGDNFNKNDVITIYVAEWGYKGLINIVGGTTSGGSEVNKLVDVVEGYTLHWPTFSKSAVLEAKVQDMIVKEIEKLLPVDR